MHYFDTTGIKLIGVFSNKKTHNEVCEDYGMSRSTLNNWVHINENIDFLNIWKKVLITWLFYYNKELEIEFKGKKNINVEKNIALFNLTYNNYLKFKNQNKRKKYLSELLCIIENTPSDILELRLWYLKSYCINYNK